MRAAIPFPAAPVAISDRTRRAAVVLGVLAGAAYLGYRPSATVVVAIYGAIALGVVLRWPAVGLPSLLLAAGFVPFTVGTGTGSDVNIAMIGTAGLAALWLVRLVLEKGVRLRPSGANRPWLALIGVAGMSIVAGGAMWSPWVSAKSTFAFVQLAQWSVFILSAAAFWLLAHDRAGRRMLGIATAIVAALGATKLASWLLPVTGAVTGRMLIDGPVLRIWFVALAAGLALFHPGMDRRLRAACLAAAALMVLLSWRVGPVWASGWLPPLVALGLMIVLGLWDRSRWLAVTAVSSGGLAYLLYRLVLVEVASTDRWSLETRLIAWRGLFDLMEGRWLLGLGLASYWHYWRGVIGSIAYLDPSTGAFHYTFDPQVNMHNNFMDVFGQMGIAGTVVLGWLLVALARQTKRQLDLEPPGFGRAFAAACLGGLGGMVFAAMLGDWIFPFVYNIGLDGFRDAFLGWLMLGGIVQLEVSRGQAEA